MPASSLADEAISLSLPMVMAHREAVAAAPMMRIVSLTSLMRSGMIRWERWGIFGVFGLTFGNRAKSGSIRVKPVFYQAINNHQWMCIICLHCRSPESKVRFIVGVYVM